MIIEREQLISLLQNKTNLGREQIEANLSELRGRIQNAVKLGKAVQVDGLGTFGVSNGKLQFVPDDTLAMEINTKYAGMKPIELIGAFKESDAGGVPVSDYSDDIETEEHIDPLTFEEQHPEPADEKTDTSSPGEEPIPEDEQKEEGPVSAEEQNEELQPKPEPVPAHSEAKPNEPNPQKPPKKAQPKKQTAATSQKGPVGRLAAILAAVLAIGIIGWFAYDLGYIGSKNTNNAEQSLSDQTAQGPKDNESEFQGSVPESDSTQNSNTNSDQDTSATKSEVPQNERIPALKDRAATTEKTESYGLKGQVVSDIGKAYMIVVHSRRRIDSAQKNKEALEGEGYRTTINRTEINGEPHFRVGVGQFKSITGAQQAIKELPEPYKSNNFITRIK